MTDLTGIRSQLRGAIPFASVQQRKFGDLLRTCKKMATEDQWADILAELGMTQRTADHYMSQPPER
jgi:hypothetical protein